VPDFTANTTSADIKFSTSVECSGQTAEQLRVVALDGLLALPRVGMGRGGYLLGKRENGQIRITEILEIPCGHSGGPSFLLTTDELLEAKQMTSALTTSQVVGWYCSKTRGPSVLSEPVLALFKTLCPESWQIMLLIRPSTVERSRAVLFVRNAGGQVVAAAEKDIETEEDREDVHPEGPEPVPVAAAPRVELPLRVTESLPRVAEALPHPELSRPLFPVPEPAPHGPWLPWALTGVVLTAGVAGSWFSRDNWLPRPALALGVTDQNGHLRIRWNSDAVRGIDSAVLSLNDGGELHSYQLDAHRLDAGMMDYDRKSPRVIATLRVGEQRAIAAFPDANIPEQNPAKTEK
jgi:hypothetical protein